MGRERETGGGGGAERAARAPQARQRRMVPSMVQVSKRRGRAVGRSESGLRKGWVGWGAASGWRKNRREVWDGERIGSDREGGGGIPDWTHEMDCWQDES